MEINIRPIKMKKLTEEECLEIGGHCWIYHKANDVLDEGGNISARHLVYYPDGEPPYRTYKHCNRT